MKKIISAVAAFGLAVGMAATASAMEFSVSGYYALDGYMLNGASGEGYGLHPATGYVGGLYNDDATTDSFWAQTFVVKPQLKINDKITMFSELRFDYDSVWGNQDNTDADRRTGIDVYHLYMEYMSPVGKIRMGRVPVGSWGGDFISSEGTGNRLMWWPSFVPEPFSLCLYTQKVTENDSYTYEDDADNDTYEIDLTYKVEDLLLRVAYDYNNYKSNAAEDRQDNRLKAYGVAKVGMVDLEAEWGWEFGDYGNFDDGFVTFNDADVDAMAFMIDASTTMDKLEVGLMYFWAEGQDADDEDITAAMVGTLSYGTGNDFNPYYILTNDWTGMLDGENRGLDYGMAWSGVNCIGVHADFQVSDPLSLHGAVAYAWADDTSGPEAVVGHSVDDEYGWEVDLGAKYKLLDNLTYEIHAAYFNTGDYFDDLSNDNGDDVYLVSNHLLMTF